MRIAVPIVLMLSIVSFLAGLFLVLSIPSCQRPVERLCVDTGAYKGRICGEVVK